MKYESFVTMLLVHGSQLPVNPRLHVRGDEEDAKNDGGIGNQQPFAEFSEEACVKTRN